MYTDGFGRPVKAAAAAFGKGVTRMPDRSVFGTHVPDTDDRFRFFMIRLLMKLGMKNPYEAEKPKLTPAILKEKAIEMRSNPQPARLLYQEDELSCQRASGAVDERYPDVLYFGAREYAERRQGFSNLAEEYAALLDLAAQELETRRIDADKSSVLDDGTDGPVTIVLGDIPYLRRGRVNLKAHDPYFERTQAGVATEVSASRKSAEYIYNVYPDHVELVKYIGLKRTVEIPAELDGLPVTHIGFDCFAMAWRVKFVSIAIPDTVTTIYHGAFRGCTYIREIKLPPGLKYIGNYAFAFLTDLEHIEIPESVVSLGMGAFRNCFGIKSVTIPNETLRIGNDCFYGCKNLETVTIGKNVVDIDDWAFRMGEHLQKVDIGENVDKIGESAFYDCIRLERLDIPEKVTRIGDAAFYHRRGMTLGVAAGSVAEKYAVDHKHKYVYTEKEE
jgi:hypothetical protein